MNDTFWFLGKVITDRPALNKSFRERLEYMDKKSYDALIFFLERQKQAGETIEYPSAVITKVVSKLLNDKYDGYAYTGALTETSEILCVHASADERKRRNKKFHEQFDGLYEEKIKVHKHEQKVQRGAVLKASDPRRAEFKESDLITGGFTTRIQRKVQRVH